MIEEIKCLIDLYNSQLSMGTNLWTLFIVVSLGLLGFVYGSNKTSKAALIVLSLAYIVFTFSNRDAVDRAQKIIYTSVVQIQSLAQILKPELKETLNTLEASPPNIVYIFHHCMSGFVVLAVWAPLLFELFRKRNQTSITIQ